MAIQLSGQNVLISGTGTYTWDDIIFLNPGNLTSTVIGGLTFYVWRGNITVSGNCILNIANRSIQLLRVNQTDQLGQIAVLDNAIVNFTSCLVYGLVSSTDFIEASRYMIVNKAIETARINAYESEFSLGFADGASVSASSRVEIFLNEIRNCSILWEKNAIEGNGGFLAKGVGSITNLQLNNFITLEIVYNTEIIIKNLTIYAAKFALTNWFQTSLMFRNLAILGTTTHDYSSSTLHYNTFIDSEVNLANGEVMKNNTTNATSEHKQAATHNIKLIDNTGNIDSALVSYQGRSPVSAVSVNGIVPEVVLIFKETNLQSISLAGAWSVYAKPLPVVDFSSYSRAIRSYAHEEYVESLTIGSKIGSTDNPAVIQLLKDSGVTNQDRVAVASYSGMIHSASESIITGNLTLAQFYDSRKLYWRNNGGICNTLEVNSANFKALNITFTTGSLSSSIKFVEGIVSSGTITLANANSITFPIVTSGIITLQSPGNYSNLKCRILATGDVIVASGITDLRGWTFQTGCDINVSSGNATVIVDSVVGITVGANVTLQAKVVTFTGFPTANNALGLAPASTLAILDPILTTWTSFDASSGSVIVPLSSVSTGAQITYRADAIGWYRTADITIDVATAPSTINLSTLFEEILDESGSPICGEGIQTEMDRISYNQSAKRFEFNGGPISYGSVVQKFEIVSSSQTGLTTFNAPIREVVFIKNAYAKAVLLPLPLVLSASESAATSPIFTDFIVSRVGDPEADVFVHGLTSTAPGLSNRPEIRQNLVQFITAKDSLTSQQVRDAMTLDATDGSKSIDDMIIRSESNIIGALM